MLTVVRYSVIRPSATSALIEMTSAPVMPRSVLAASWTATSAASAKPCGDDPMMVTTLATFAMRFLLAGLRVLRACTRSEPALVGDGRLGTWRRSRAMTHGARDMALCLAPGHD